MLDQEIKPCAFCGVEMIVNVVANTTAYQHPDTSTDDNTNDECFFMRTFILYDSDLERWNRRIVGPHELQAMQDVSDTWSHEPTLVPVPDDHLDDDEIIKRNLWARAYVESSSNGRHADKCISIADAIVEDYDKRFNPKEEGEEDVSA